MKGPMRTRFALAVIAICVFCSGLPGQDAPGAAETSTIVGHPAPDFELKVLGSRGKTMKLSDLKGKAVLIDFWATYCGPCKVEMPWIAGLQKKYGPEGFQAIGISMDDAGEKTVSEFAKKLGVNYPILIGTEKVADLYGGLEGLPVSFFVDRTGKVVDQELGLIGQDVFEENVKKALGPNSGQIKTQAAK